MNVICRISPSLATAHIYMLHVDCFIIEGVEIGSEHYALISEGQVIDEETYIRELQGVYWIGRDM